MNLKEYFKEIEPVTEDYVFTFGKYRGLPLSIVLERDFGYLLWAEENVVTFVLSEELWTKALMSYVDRVCKNREDKLSFIHKTNDIINKLSSTEKDRRRRKYYSGRESSLS